MLEQFEDLGSDQALELLDEAIKLYFRSVWREDGEDVESTVIVHWLVPVFFRTFGEVETNGYSVQAAKGMAAHEMKGLMLEGESWIQEEQDNGGDFNN